MLQEYLKINNPRQQRKYLDKKAQEFNKRKMTVDEAKEVVELNDYLESIHFWQKYNSTFDRSVKEAQALVLELKVDELKKELTEEQLQFFDQSLASITDYEKDVVVDAYDAQSKDLESIIVLGSIYPEQQRNPSIIKCEELLLKVMKMNGSLEVHYFKKRRILKKIKV